MNWVELKTFFFQKVQHVSELIQPYKALNTQYTCMGSGLAVDELVGLAVQLVA
jgi:hypothetical protein